MTTQKQPTGAPQDATPPVPALGAAPPQRTYEVAALREDGSLLVTQLKAPTSPLFEAAFGALSGNTVLDATSGPIAIENLQPGDRLRTQSGPTAEVIWIGTTTFVPADMCRRLSLVRVMADTFGPSQPESFVTLGPAARITRPLRSGQSEREQLLTPAQHFVDGMDVISITPPTPIRLYHLCLSQHAVIFANGLPVETYHPGGDALTGLSTPEKLQFLSMFPRVHDLRDFGPLVMGRASDDGPGLPH